MMSNQAEFPIEIMARSMGVSRSGFYAWQCREPSARDVADRELTDLIRAQRAYSSNATVIQTVDEMLQETTNL